MAEKTKKRRKITRPPRIRVPNQEKALFTADTGKFVGVIQFLSITGGSVLLSSGTVAPGTSATIEFKTAFGKVTAQIEFLQIGAEGKRLAQAFRFTDMEEGSSKRLAAATKQMQKAGLSDAGVGSQSLGEVASQTFSKLRDGIQKLSTAISKS